MIQMKDVHFVYERGNYEVFNGLSLTLEPNCICGLLGKNGTGKSTLLYLICGLLRSKSGEILIDERNVWRREPETLREIYLVPEEIELPHLQLKDLIYMHRDFYPRFSEETLKECFEDFEVTPRKNLSTLSMGQKKKVLMSFALAAGTRYVLMDEPTNGLDIPSKSLFRKVVAKNMSEDKFLLISTHQVHDVENLLDHIILLGDKNVLVDTSVADITQEYVFETSANGMDKNNILYAEPSLQGNATIRRRQEGEEESVLNLELYFNAMISGKLK